MKGQCQGLLRTDVARCETVLTHGIVGRSSRIRPPSPRECNVRDRTVSRSTSADDRMRAGRAGLDNTDS